MSDSGDAAAAELLTTNVRALVERLERQFGPRRRELLELRRQRQRRFDAGELPEFAHATAEVREGPWTVTPAPKDLEDRRVEITGPVDAKMMINALNSGASVFMADFEDSLSPTWANVMGGHRHVRDAYRRSLRLDVNGRSYRLADTTATLCLRPRGWHLSERHATVDGHPVSASLFDVGVALALGAREALDAGSGPYFYLPKLEHHLEAVLWNDVFDAAEEALGLERGSVRVTVLIETLPAAFQMHEILHALRTRITGLNAGRWDYIFSLAKRMGGHREFVLGDRSRVTMTVPFMRAYTDLLVETCHARGAHAIGGMAALIPDRRDPVRNAQAMEGVRADKRREAADGFDGTWVAHPDLVAVARAEFDAVLGDRPNQLDRLRDTQVDATSLLAVAACSSPPSTAGLVTNVDVGLRYLWSWLSGAGAVAINGLMEDAATAEICRAQLWQWVRHGIALEDGTPVTTDRVRRILAERVADLAATAAPEQVPLLHAAADLFAHAALDDEFVEFLTVPGYPLLP